MMKLSIYILLVYAHIACAAKQVTTDKHSEYTCVAGFGETCNCGPPCLKQNSNVTCIPKDCFEYDYADNTCKNTGPEKSAAVWLSAIPLTGVFGSGFGNIGRWDLFAIGMGILFGPLCLFCCIGACCVFCSSQKEEDDTDTQTVCSAVFGQIFGCCWGIAILVFYIWQIVIIVNGEVLGPNGCSLADTTSPQSGSWTKPTKA